MKKILPSFLNFKFSKKFYTLLLFIVLGTLLILFIAVNFASLKLISFTQLENLGVIKVSTAEITRQGNDLNIVFNIQPKDKDLAKGFSNHLGVSEQWQQGLRFSLNEETISQFDLPVILNLSFGSEKELAFKSREKTLSLLEGLPKEQYQVATGSSKAQILGSSLKKFSLELEEPEQVLKEATISGKITVSPVFLKMFSSLSKVSTISLRVDGKAIEGNIKLK